MSDLEVPGAGKKIRVLLADDSMLVRHQIRRILEAHPQIIVIDEARDGVEAVAKSISLQPDVLVLDVEMPGMNGISALREIMKTRPLPVLMFSSLTKKGAQVTLEALSIGAVDFLLKPASRDELVNIGPELCQKVLEVSRARIRPARARFPRTTAGRKPVISDFPEKAAFLVVIGSSTGGPQALEEVIPNLAPDLPASVVVCQHMPRGFTASLARRLDLLSQIRVREAQEGDLLLPRRVLVAPGGYHLRIEKSPSGEKWVYRVHLDQGPPIHGVRPSVDVTLFDAAPLFVDRLMVVILTGMGSDGAKGAWASKKTGARVICQDRETSVVWGMPRACYELGAADKLLPIDRIASSINEFCRGTEER
ncbi:MAG TPA: chemotaxis response regulator protein-glutamate methylesterase [Firmicutes bacterium]|nr:chemotaxis response regulator protein-glutamate methylesterase [Candidatus Fermentithermobacillaceae bacterium]